MLSSNNNKDKPDTIRIIEKHFTSLLEGEIRDALSDQHKLQECEYEPPRYKTISLFETAHSYGQMICRILSNGRFWSSFTIQFPNEFNIKEIVDGVNNHLMIFPGTRRINLQQVLDKYFCDLIIVAPIKPTQSAVFITGEDPLLGSWKTATRLSFCESTSRWRFFVPFGVIKREILFLEGDWSLGKKVNAANLKKDPCGIRLLPIEDEKKAEAEKEPPNAPKPTEENKVIKRLNGLKLA